MRFGKILFCMLFIIVRLSSAQTQSDDALIASTFWNVNGMTTTTTDPPIFQLRNLTNPSASATGYIRTDCAEGWLDPGRSFNGVFTCISPSCPGFWTPPICADIAHAELFVGCLVGGPMTFANCWNSAPYNQSRLRHYLSRRWMTLDGLLRRPHPKVYVHMSTYNGFCFTFDEWLDCIGYD